MGKCWFSWEVIQGLIDCQRPGGLPTLSHSLAVPNEPRNWSEARFAGHSFHSYAASVSLPRKRNLLPPGYVIAAATSPIIIAPTAVVVTV